MDIKKTNKKQKAKEYSGKYDDIMEGEYLVMMRRAIEDLDAGKKMVAGLLTGTFVFCRTEGVLFDIGYSRS